MAKVRAQGKNSLHYTASLSIDEAKRNAQELKKVLADLGINSASQSQKQFNAMQVAFQDELRKSRLELAKLKKEEQELKNTRLQTAADIAEINKQLAKNRLEQQEMRKAAKEAKEANKATSGSYREAQERLKALGAEIRNTTNGMHALTPELKAKIKEYRELNDRLKEFDATMGNHQRNVGNYKSALDGLKNYLAGFLTLQTVLQGLRFMVTVNSEISDSLADVQRTAGLTADEAENLSEQLKKIDTRTSLKGLLEISAIGGQLGIAKDQLGGFTKAVDQLAVSLSGELEGGAEGIAKALGVIDNVFGITASNAGDVEKSYNQIGSAILGLGQSGLATGDYLTDFANRVGGLAKQFGISLPIVLAYGAVLQESGVNAEVAGSSFNRLISNLTTNREQFFAVAKIADASLTLKEFTDIINNDTDRALGLFFAGLQKGGSSTTAFNDILKSLKLTGAGVSQAVAALSGHQQELNGHITQAKKDFDEATLSTEQFKIKNDNLAGSMEKLNNSFENAVSKGRIRDFFKSIVDGLTSAVVSFDKFVNSKSWTEFRHRLLDADGGDSWALSDSFIKNQRNTRANTEFLYPMGVTPESMEQKLRSRGEKFNQEYLKRLKKTMEEAKALSDEYEEGVAKGKYKENERTLKDYKINYNQAKGYYEDVAKLQAKLGFGPKAAPAKPKATTEILIGGKKDKGLDSAVEAQRRMQARIDELNEVGKGKQEVSDQQEIDAIKRKYQKMLDEAIAFNKNKKNIERGLKVNTSGLAASQKVEIDSTIDRQLAKKLKDDIETEKKAYEEFEKYKTTYGLAAAKERYKDKINTDISYLQRLQQLEDNILNPEKGKGAENVYDGKSEQQLKLLREKIKDETEAENKKYDLLLESLMGYERKREIMVQTNTERRKLIAGSANEEELRLFDKNHLDSLHKLDDENTQKLAVYKALFDNIEDLSEAAARKVVADAKSMLDKLIASGKISEELAKSIKKKLEEATKSVNERLGKMVRELGVEIKNLGSMVEDVDFGKWVVATGEVLNNFGGILERGSSISEKWNSMRNLEKITAGGGLLGLGLGIVNSITGVFNQREQKRQEQFAYQNELQLKQYDAMNKALDRQISLIGRAYDVDKITEYTAAQKKAEENQAIFLKQLEGRALLTGNQVIDKYIKANNEGYVFGNAQDRVIAADIKKQYGNFDFAKATTEELENLITAGNKLDESTARLVQNLIDARRAAEDLGKAANYAGTDFEGIRSGLIEAVTSGANQAATNFNDIIRKSLLSFLEDDPVLKTKINEFYKQLAEASKNGIDAGESADLKKKYDEIVAYTEQQKKELERISGTSLGDTAKNQGSLSRSIQGITETTANRLESEIGGMRLAQLQTNVILTPIGKSIADLYLIARDNFAVQQQIERNTYRTANNTTNIPQIVDELKSLNKKVADAAAIKRGGGIP